MTDDHSPKLEGDIEALPRSVPANDHGNSVSVGSDGISQTEHMTAPAITIGRPDAGTIAEQSSIAQSNTDQAAASSAETSKQQPASEKPQRIDFSGGLQSLLITVIIALFIITFIVQAFQIPSESMENTLLVGDYLLVNKIEYGRPGAWSWLFPYREIQRDDVIVFHYPVKPEMYFVKRVIAIPGDRVRLQAGKLYVNGALQEESFVIHRTQMPDIYRDDFPNGKRFNANINPIWWHRLPSFVDQGELVVPRDCYFALGDNRDDSSDSRYWGFVPRENVVGRPLIIYFSHVVSRPIPQSREAGLSDKLTSLADTVINLAHSVRWKRAMRVIR